MLRGVAPPCGAVAGLPPASLLSRTRGNQRPPNGRQRYGTLALSGAFSLACLAVGYFEMWWPIKIFLVLGVLLLGQSAWAFVDGFRFLSLVRRRRNSPRGSYAPSAAVMIPCKGVDAAFDANLDRFLNQDYPSYWDTSIATMMGDHDHNFAWGGSMAIRAADFNKLGIAERYWANTVSDDFALTRAVREAGGNITFEPRCLVASREESSLREFLVWSTRQIIITRVYAAHWWKLGLATYLFYCGTLTLGLMVLAMPGATTYRRVAVAITLLTILLLGAGKGYTRSLVARELYATEIGSRASCYWQLSPLVPWIMLWNFVVAGFIRRIEWRGTEYELVSRDKVRVLGRSGG